MKPLYVGLDGGGSRTLAAVYDAEGRELARSATAGSNHLLTSARRAAGELTDAFDAVLEAAGARADEIAACCAGLAGVDIDGRGGEEIRAAAAPLRTASALVVSDMEIAHTAALAAGPGVVVLAGSGSVVYGEDKHGRQAKVGGWGPVYGNEGSGYALGKAALIAAARAYDGRGPRTALLDAVLDRMGLHDFSHSPETIYSDGPSQGRIAELGKAVDLAAIEGDAEAIRILREAGRDLAHSAAAAVRRLFANEPVCPVSYQGGAIRSSRMLRESFASDLRRIDDRVQIQEPRFEPVYGAFLRATRGVHTMESTP